MKYNKSILFGMFLLAMMAMVGCSSDDDAGNIAEGNSMQIGKEVLSQYKWKLCGYVSTTGSKPENVPESVFANSFSICFEENGTFKGYCATDWFSGSYATNGTSLSLEMKDNSFFQKNLDPYREIYKEENELFYQRVCSCTHYGIFNNQLRLYYNKKNDYLLFDALEK